MSNLSLYNITNKFIDLFEKAENEELTQEEIQERGNQLALSLRNKSTSVIAYSRQLELTEDAISTEIKRLTDMKKVIVNRHTKFKEYVKENMEMLNLQKVDTPLGTLTIAKNPVSVEIFDESLIADEYKKEKVIISIDKIAIKDAIKNGENVQGAKLVEDKTSLRIK